MTTKITTDPVPAAAGFRGGGPPVCPCSCRAVAGQGRPTGPVRLVPASPGPPSVSAPVRESSMPGGGFRDIPSGRTGGRSLRTEQPAHAGTCTI